MIIAWCGMTNSVRAQVSPGPLSRAHADLDGNLSCTKCHGKGEGVMDQKCLACHDEVATMIAERRGFHGREARSKCASCHPDHGGRDFAMVAWPGGSAEKFDHARTGFPLTGRHATTACRACHAPQNLKGQVAARIKRDKRGHSWLGLDTKCAACHQDIHRGSFGSDCESCHSTAAFKPVANFDHSRTAFALTGKHARVQCASCHEAAHLALKRDSRGHPVPLYKPLPHEECSACHADVHKGAFGATCSRCHSTAGFRHVDEARFDHDRTRYPLRGKHAALACASCHDPKHGWGKKPPFANCSGCHRDPHAGQATLAGKPADCAACHAVGGFAASTFDVARHASTPFPLRGTHASTACVKCHGEA
ncbi:MAG TPA: cytochrome c3 family protein, partial [Candidatus Krumholzibacteria bacterium]|nr:cytochrome c3 family protein [Candidatus Krumholzibacteria bacterium]